MPPQGRKASGIRVERAAESGFFEVLGLPRPSPLFASRRAAEAWMERTLAALPHHRRRRERNCLTCGKIFVSEGAHNRMCDYCRRESGDDCAAYSVSRGSRNGIRIGVR